MYKNRLVLILVTLSMLLVTLAVSRPFSKPSKTVDLSQSPGSVVVPVTGPEGGKAYMMDSGTRSYIAWGESIEKTKLNALDSGTRSYIAWGEALEAAGKPREPGTCLSMTQENIFAGIPDNLDSATRSYIAWGLALQAKNGIGAICR